LEYLKGNNISLNDHINAITIFRKHGIEPYASFIIGSPQEGKEDILQTLSFIKENRLHSFDLYVLTPFPGTPIWDYARARNLVNEDIDWDLLNVNFKPNSDKGIILSEKLTRAEICGLFSRFAKCKRKIRRKMKRKLKTKRIFGHLKSLSKVLLKTCAGESNQHRKASTC
jgi:radical SAM superfamily enzyme YgiQ (UPF0313 family)